MIINAQIKPLLHILRKVLQSGEHKSLACSPYKQSSQWKKWKPFKEVGFVINVVLPQNVTKTNIR